MKEIWKDIPWYEWLYQASNLGRIKNKISWAHLKWSKNDRWYVRVALNKNKIKKEFKIHRLIALSFLDNTENKPQINHINWIKYDNKLENLEWCTLSENQIHRYKVLKKGISKSWLNKTSKKVNQYDLDWNLIKTWDCIKDIKRQLKIDDSSVIRCCKWKQFTSWWFTWKYFW